MKLIAPFIILFISLFPFGVIAQTFSDEELEYISFDSLWKIDDTPSWESSEYRNITARMLKKSKRLKDTNDIFNGYMFSVWNWPNEVGQVFADSLIAFADAIGELDKISLAHYVKGGRYYNDVESDKALGEFILSYNYAVQANDLDYEIAALDMIASIKSEHGEEAEAIRIRRKILRILEENETNKEIFGDYDINKVNAFDGLARAYLHNLNVDSARYFAKKGLEMSKELNESEIYETLVVLDAQINYEDNNFIKARDTLLKYSSRDDPLGEADAYYYLGMLEEVVGIPEMKSVYFKKIDSILSTEDFPIIDNVEEVYQFLVQNAIQDDDKTRQSHYMDRLVYYDSLIEQTEKTIKNISLAKFDLPLQEKEKEIFQVTILKKEKTLRILGVIIFLATLGLLFFYIRYVKIKRRFSHIISKTIVPIIEEKEISVKKSKSLGIDQEAMEFILKGLEKWENDLGYLNRDTNQNSLAKDLETNSTYLSRIINAHKKQNFSQYLNDLRVTYAVNQLKENPDVASSKSLIQLAELFGFNYTDSFIRAFKSKVGITPSIFLRRLKKGDL